MYGSSGSLQLGPPPVMPRDYLSYYGGPMLPPPVLHPHQAHLNGAMSRHAINGKSPIEPPLKYRNDGGQHSSTSEAASTSSTPRLRQTASQQKHGAGPNWSEFYKNGPPKEIIVIDDDSPPPTSSLAQPGKPSASTQQAKLPSSQPNGVHLQQHGPQAHHLAYHPVTKRRKAGDVHDESVHTQPNGHGMLSGHHVYHTHLGTSARGSTDQKIQPQSTTTTSSDRRLNLSNGYNHDRDVGIGQKRKRDSVNQTVQTQAQLPPPKSAAPPPLRVLGPETYHPPPRPPVKAREVYVPKIRDPYITSVQVDDDEGHFHVRIDTMIGDRYRINRILGQGTFGKVVEATDCQTGQRVAIKIIRAVQKYRDASRIELRVLQTLAQNDKLNLNRCIHLRACFDFRNHICIVTDLLGQSVFDFLKSNAFVPFPSSQIQHFARQLFTSVAFLHDLNLIHTDLKPENILLVNNNYQTFTYGRWVPSSSTTVARRAAQRRVLLDSDIRLIDFGSATFDDEYHSSVVSTRHYRAPEIILNLGWTFPCDIWSIGCILVEFFTGDALFQTHDNVEHLAMMQAVCGNAIDLSMIRQVQTGRGRERNAAASFFSPRTQRLDYPNAETSKASRKYVKAMKKLTEIIPATTPFNKLFIDLLKQIFVFDPRKRITAKKALQHPWFQEMVRDDGTEALRLRQLREEERQRQQAAEIANRTIVLDPDDDEDDDGDDNDNDDDSGDDEDDDDRTDGEEGSTENTTASVTAPPSLEVGQSFHGRVSYDDDGQIDGSGASGADEAHGSDTT